MIGNLHSGNNKCKAASSLSSASAMITKLERTQNSANQKKDLAQNTHKEWDSASTNGHQIGIQSKTQRIITTD